MKFAGFNRSGIAAFLLIFCNASGETPSVQGLASFSDASSIEYLTDAQLDGDPRCLIELDQGFSTNPSIDEEVENSDEVPYSEAVQSFSDGTDALARYTRESPSPSLKSGTSPDEVVEKYKKIIMRLTDPGTPLCFEETLGLSFFELMDADLHEILCKLDEGISAHEIFLQLGHHPDLSGLEGASEGTDLDSSFEMSVEILMALRNGVDSNKILQQFEIALNADMLSIFNSGELPFLPLYKSITNLIRTVGKPDRFGWIPRKIRDLCRWQNDNSQEFHRIAHAMCPQLADDALSIIQGAGLTDAVDKIISSPGFYANSVGSSSALMLYLISDICDGISSGIGKEVISNLLKKYRFDKSGALNTERVQSFYFSLCLAVVKRLTSEYLKDHAEVEQIGASIKHAKLREYLSVLLRTGLVKLPCDESGDAFATSLCLSDDPESVVRMYADACSVVESAISQGVDPEKLFDEILSNVSCPDITKLTDSTAEVLAVLVENLKNDGEVSASDEVLEAQSGGDIPLDNDADPQYEEEAQSSSGMDGMANLGSQFDTNEREEFIQALG